jgi:hypothetical protein
MTTLRAVRILAAELGLVAAPIALAVHAWLSW